MQLAELERLGVEGRRTLVEEWATFLPTYADPFTIVGSSLSVGSSSANLSGSVQQTSTSFQPGVESGSPSRSAADLEAEEDHDDEDDGEGFYIFYAEVSIAPLKHIFNY